MQVKTAIELRDLAKAIEQACLESPCAGPAMPIVRNCVDHLNCLARIQHAKSVTGIVVVVAIGLLWSIAVMSNWVPVASAEMRSAAVIQPYEDGRHKAAAQ